MVGQARAVPAHRRAPRFARRRGSARGSSLSTSSAPPPSGPAGAPRLPTPLSVAAVAVVATIIARVADGLLEAQALAAMMGSAVLIDLLVGRVGGELPNERTLVVRLRDALPFAWPGLAVSFLVVAASLVLGQGRIAGATFDPASFALGLARAFASVARRQLPYVVLPLALLGGRVDPRAIIVFGGLCAAATVVRAGDSALSVLVHLTAGLLGAAVIVRSRDFLAGLLAEGSVYFVVGTVCTSVLDVRMGSWALTPIERVSGPYGLALALGLLAATAWIVWREPDRRRL